MVISPKKILDNLIDNLEQEIDKTLQEEFYAETDIVYFATKPLCEELIQAIKRDYEKVGWEVAYTAKQDKSLGGTFYFNQKNKK